MSEEIVIVDTADREIGFCSKMEAHRKGLLHRAFSVFIVSGSDMLIQRRALGKYHSGGLWANACCSHPRKGETLAEAIPRRLKEELGIETMQANEIFSFRYHHQFSGDLFEHEFDHVFVADYDEGLHGSIDPNRDEIHETQWVSLVDLEMNLEREPQRYAVWFKIAAPRVLEYLRNR